MAVKWEERLEHDGQEDIKDYGEKLYAFLGHPENVIDVQRCLYLDIDLAGRVQIPFPLLSPNAPFEELPTAAATFRPQMAPLEVPPPPPPDPLSLTHAQTMSMQQQTSAEQYHMSQSTLQQPQPLGGGPGVGGEFWLYPGDGHGNCGQHYSDVNEA